MFKKLPREVYDCILAQLDLIYQDHNQACTSCYLGDLHSLSLTSRAWDKAASAVMYRKALVITNEEHGGLPKLKTKGTSRLKLLRRTLRENAGLSRRVLELHLSDFQLLYENATIEREEIVDLVASLVMACPRLERLVGFHVHFSQAFDRLSHALSTRRNLKERVWMLTNADGDTGADDDDETIRGNYIAECDPTERFLDLSSQHSMLSSLVLFQEQCQSLTHLNFRAVVGTFRNSPHLQNLAISGLAAHSFTNMALNAIPTNLQSLRLENLPGITEKGIQRLATSQQAVSIQKLTLVDLEIGSVLTIADILSPRLTSLKEFSLVQTRAPTLSRRNFDPEFGSPSVRYIHWEIRSEASPLPSFISPTFAELPESQPFPFANVEPICCHATSLLAASIQANAFPLLRRIRIPHDPQGVIQSLCKPLATALLPSDTSKIATASRISTPDGFSIILEEPVVDSAKTHRASTYGVTSTSRVDSVVGSPTFESNHAAVALTPMRSRLAAQSRILAARKDAAMTICVSSPEGEVKVNKIIGGHVGYVGSKITYDLRADNETVGRTEWIVGMNDLVGNAEKENRDMFESSRRSCGHLVGSGGGNVVGVEDLF
ncbi:hypothetical protein J4E91_001053 [Alternaria rosae]|nr:hypothetical protein J4E91_001053 [Alternaria rosae]